MKIYLDNNLGVTNVEQEELTQDTIGYNILKVYIPNAVLTPYDTFTCYYGALLQNGRKVGWFAMEARTSSDADYEANYTLYKATLEQCVVSVEGKVYIGCQILLGNSGNATLIKKNTAVVQFNVRKSVAINNDILVLDPDQTNTDVLESYKNLLENALLTYATKAEVYTKAQVDALLLQKADKSNTYTKSEVYNKTETNALLDTKADKSTTYTKTQVDSALATKADKSNTYTKTEINNYKKMWDNLVYSCEFTIDDSAKTMAISGNWAFTKYSFIVIDNIAVKTISYANLSLGNYCLVIRNNALEFVNFANAIQDGDMVLWIGFLDGTGDIRTDIYRCNNKVTNLALYCSDNIKIDTTNKNFVIPSAYLFWNSGYASISAQNISYSSYLNATCVLVYRNGVFKVLGLQNIELFYNDVIVAVVWFRSDGFPMSKIYVVNEAPDKAITELPLSSKIFMRVGVIGDSYTSGWIKDNDHKNNPNYSWVKHMKQLTGNEWTNFGVSGSSTKSWVDGTLGQLPQVQTKGNKCQAYVIGLMINDQNQGMQTYVPLGTSSDIGTNANSYYAYYYKLINALLSVNSSAIIFCNTCPRTDGDFPSYNQAVIDVVNSCQNESKNVYLVELRNYYWRNETFNNDALNGHYTAIGYEYMAEIFNKAFSDTINANASSLKEVNLIPYDSATVYDYVDNAINDLRWELGSNTLDVESDTTTSFSKSVPSGAIGCQINKVGGMSYKVNGTIQHSAVTQIRSKNGSTIVDSLSIPSYIRNIEGYGWGINNTCYNYIDFDRKVFVQKVGIINLGIQGWDYNSQYQVFYCYINGKKNGKTNVLCEKYTTADKTFQELNDKEMTGTPSGTGLNVKDTSYNNVTTFKSAMNGVYLYYELATPVETDISAYLTTDTIDVEPLGTIEFTNTYSQDVPSDIDYLIEEVKA